MRSSMDLTTRVQHRSCPIRGCPELTDGVFRSAGEHAERIAVACARKPDGDPLVIELGEVW